MSYHSGDVVAPDVPDIVGECPLVLPRNDHPEDPSDLAIPDGGHTLLPAHEDILHFDRTDSRWAFKLPIADDPAAQAAFLLARTVADVVFAEEEATVGWGKPFSLLRLVLVASPPFVP